MLNANTLNSIFDNADAQALDFITEYEVRVLCSDHGQDADLYFAENSKFTATIDSVFTWLGY